MRLKFIAAVSTAALIAGAAVAQDVEAEAEVGAAAETAVQAAPAPGDFTDDELRGFDAAMQRIQPIAQAAQGAPNEDQQAQMAAAIEESGLSIDRFNAIAAAVSQDAGLRARVALAATPPSAPGSVGAGVTDAEVASFASAMAQIVPIAQAAQGQPSDEQQAQMAAAIEASGLELDRFNAISGAVSQDAHLRARVELATAQGSN